jgi:FAD-dependent sensor of blue light
MLRIFYISAATRFATASELNEILAIARKRNSADNITGVLLYHDGSFAQILEGPEKAVRACFQRIQNDPRHSGCSIILEESATERYFENWSMECVPVVKFPAKEQDDFMTLKQFQESSQFEAAQSCLFLKSFLKSFSARPETPQSRQASKNRIAASERLLKSHGHSSCDAENLAPPHKPLPMNDRGQPAKRAPAPHETEQFAYPRSQGNPGQAALCAPRQWFPRLAAIRRSVGHARRQTLQTCRGRLPHRRFLHSSQVQRVR